MIIEELVARLGFTVEGLEKLRRVASVFQRLHRAIAAFAAVVARRLGRVGIILARVSGGLVKLGAGFIARSALITGAAIAAQGALMKLAAGFAALRRATIDQAFVKGVPIKELDLVERLMTRIGASAKDGQKWLGEFVDKVREGQREGGDFADALAKQGVRLKGAKGQAKTYSQVIDDILRASDKIADPEKKRSFLVESLPGAPDELLSQLLQATSALERWRKLVTETAKTGGRINSGDILNAQDITDAIGKISSALTGFKDAIGSGLMAAFAGDFRRLGEAVAAFATEENRKKLREFAGSIGRFLQSVREGGFIVLSKVADALGSIMEALSRVNAATGERLQTISAALGAFLLALGAARLASGIAAAAVITGLLAALNEFSKWKGGEATPLAEFFDAVANGANTAAEALRAFMAEGRGLARYLFGDSGLEQPRPGAVPDVTPMPNDPDEWRKRRQEMQRRQNEADPNARKALERGTQSPSWLEMLKSLFRKSAEMSPERQTQKMAADKAAATETDNRKYENIGNDQRTISAPITVNANGLDAVAQRLRTEVLGAISSKGANTSTGALTAP